MMGQPLGDMGTLAVEFEWPFEVANGKWLLYLTKIVVMGESEVECNPPGEIVNLLNLTVRIFFFLDLLYSHIISYRSTSYCIILIPSLGWSGLCACILDT